MKYYCLLFKMMCWCVAIYAQADIDETTSSSNSIITNQDSTESFVVGEIYIEGNKRTRPYIIHRELPFKKGDSIRLPDLLKGFEIARQQLMNTTLFNDAVVALRSFRGYHVDVLIQVKERWYLFPIPYIKPVDRNLSEWAKQGYGADRLNYGFKFTYYNFTGRNDKLRMWFITGYTKQIQFQYDQPYADKTLKHGYKIGFFYSTNKEINYATIGNQQSFIDSLPAGAKRWTGHIDYTYRPGLRTFHSLRLGVTQQEVDTQVLILNPKYFNSSNNKVTFPELIYTLQYYNVDYIPYPLTGWMGDVSFVKRGIHSNVNMWQLSGKVLKGWQINKNTYFGHQAFGVLRVPFNQPFINQQLLGYGDFYLRGLEKYVIDGVASVVSKQTFRRQLFKFSIPTYLKSKSHDRIPFRIYAKAFTDVGYVHNKNFPNNSLTNKFLYTAGVGVDMVTFYDFVLRFDYSFNQLGQKGLFLHVKNDF